MQVQSKFDYFGIKANDMCDVVEVCERDSFAASFYKVTVGDDPRIHYLLFAEVVNERN